MSSADDAPATAEGQMENDTNGQAVALAKRVRSISKKLRQIEDLHGLDTKALTTEQLQKLASEAALMEERAMLESRLNEIRSLAGSAAKWVSKGTQLQLAEYATSIQSPAQAAIPGGDATDTTSDRIPVSTAETDAAEPCTDHSAKVDGRKIMATTAALGGGLQGTSKEGKSNELVKRERNLFKRLRSALALQSDHARGKVLNDEQRFKVLAIPALEQELSLLRQRMQINVIVGEQAGLDDHPHQATIGCSASVSMHGTSATTDTSNGRLIATPVLPSTDLPTRPASSDLRKRNGTTPSPAVTAANQPPAGRMESDPKIVHHTQTVSTRSSARPSAVRSSAASIASWEEADLTLPAEASSTMRSTQETKESKVADNQFQSGDTDADDGSPVARESKDDEEELTSGSSPPRAARAGVEAWQKHGAWGDRGGSASGRGGQPSGEKSAAMLERLYSFKSSAPRAKTQNRTAPLGELLHLDTLPSSALGQSGSQLQPAAREVPPASNLAGPASIASMLQQGSSCTTASASVASSVMTGAAVVDTDGNSNLTSPGLRPALEPSEVVQAKASAKPTSSQPPPIPRSHQSPSVTAHMSDTKLASSGVEHPQSMRLHGASMGADRAVPPPPGAMPLPKTHADAVAVVPALPAAAAQEPPHSIPSTPTWTGNCKSTSIEARRVVPNAASQCLKTDGSPMELPVAAKQAQAAILEIGATPSSRSLISGTLPHLDDASVLAARMALEEHVPFDEELVAAAVSLTVLSLLDELEAAESASLMTLTMEDFQLLRLVGKGGYGKVFQVRCGINNQVYAMKVVDKASIERYRSMENITLELAILRTHAELRHPFILGLECAFQSESKLHFVMEYVPGGMLFAHLRSHEMFSEKMARFYAAEVMLGLEHLHSLSIIYRDLKPENVLICADGNAKLCDFGLAAVGLTAPATHTSASGRPVLIGTTEYMAPEVLRRLQCGQAVDVWAVGILLFEMMTGETPWWHKEQKELQRKIAHTKLRLPTWFTNEAKTLIKGLLTKDPAQRLGVLQGSESFQSDFKSLKAHPFFRNLNWKLLLMQKLEAPFVPTLSSDDPTLDVSNFDSKYTLEAPVLSPLRRPLSEEMAEQFDSLTLAYSSPEIRTSLRNSLRDSVRSSRYSCDSTSSRGSERESFAPELLRFRDRGVR